jgi:serine/threonine protein kinase
VRDIQSEAFILSQISHTNIIKVHGCALPAGSNHERNQYFLILDRLDETMMDRLEKWKSQARRWSNPILTGILDGNGHRRKHFLAERLQVATEIATALEYLHENRIIYRDLKPGNLGFCPKTGQVILFDFGLARRLPEETFKVVNDTYKMTGKVGTYRYMANEVARGRTYNELADVYSFSMVFWHLLALEKPFKTMNKQVYNVLVTRGGERPPIDSHWPRAISQLLKKAWSPDICDRPSMTEIIALLKGVMMELNGEKPTFCDITTVCTSDSLEQEALKSDTASSTAAPTSSEAMPEVISFSSS